MITLSGETNASVFDPKLEAIEDIVVHPRSFYFSNSKKGVIKKTMKKTKLEEVTISDKPKHTMLWNLMDVEPQQMEKEIDLTLEAFANMSAWIVNELYDELYQ